MLREGVAMSMGVVVGIVARGERCDEMWITSCRDKRRRGGGGGRTSKEGQTSGRRGSRRDVLRVELVGVVVELVRQRHPGGSGVDFMFGSRNLGSISKRHGRTLIFHASGTPPGRRRLGV